MNDIMKGYKKAIIELNVPEWQIGQEVSIYFPDSMVVHGKTVAVEDKLDNLQQDIDDKLNDVDYRMDNNLCIACGRPLVEKGWRMCTECLGTSMRLMKEFKERR